MTDDVTARLDEIRPGLTDLYKDLHANPELSFQEHRTAGEIARRLEAIGVGTATGVGRTGVVGTLRNGDGPTVLLRADFDALPVAERTGLPYASTVKATDPEGHEVPVMHACGHDMHVTCLLGALDLLIAARADWNGTVLAVFQPAEEIGGGARAMVEDGIFDRFGKPDVVLGQHVMPLPAGMLGVHAGPAFAATDALQIKLYGKGGHGSMPEAAIDPVVMAASTVMRLQTVVSREIAGGDTAVVTVGSMRAGTKDNIIPDEAELKLNIRTFTEPVRKKVLAAVERIIKAEAAASGALRDPEIIPIGTFPLLTNDPEATERTAQALRARFGNEMVVDPGAVPGSEDVGIFATAAGVPICYWLFGGTDPERFAAAATAGTVEREIPFNHSPEFAPVIEPTLTTGVTAMYTAARAWLGGR